MGQKCSSTSLRLGLNKNWLSCWIAPDKKTTIQWILEDEKIRLYLDKKCEKAGVGLVRIERGLNLSDKWEVKVFLHLVQPALVESNPKEVDNINKAIKKIVGKTTLVFLNILELKNPGVCACILVKDIATALESRSPFRITMKRTLRKAMSSGAKGVKIKVTGRLNGVEIARSEGYSEGSIPLSTLRADIDYYFGIAQTTYGVIGIKVWVNRGLYFGKYFMPLPPAHENPRWRDGYQNNRNYNKNKFIAKTY